jgi:hypothetical protein
MSWYCGSQETTFKLLVYPKMETEFNEIKRIWAQRLAWVTITPLGKEVDPEVYCKKAKSSGAGLGSTSSSVWA